MLPKRKTLSFLFHVGFFHQAFFPLAYFSSGFFFPDSVCTYVNICYLSYYVLEQIYSQKLYFCNTIYFHRYKIQNYINLFCFYMYGLKFMPLHYQRKRNYFLNMQLSLISQENAGYVCHWLPGGIHEECPSGWANFHPLKFADGQISWWALFWWASYLVIVPDGHSSVHCQEVLPLLDKIFKDCFLLLNISPVENPILSWEKCRQVYWRPFATGHCKIICLWIHTYTFVNMYKVLL